MSPDKERPSIIELVDQLHNHPEVVRERKRQEEARAENSQQEKEPSQQEEKKQ